MIDWTFRKWFGLAIRLFLFGVLIDMIGVFVMTRSASTAGSAPTGPLGFGAGPIVGMGIAMIVGKVLHMFAALCAVLGCIRFGHELAVLRIAETMEEQKRDQREDS